MRRLVLLAVALHVLSGAAHATPFVMSDAFVSAAIFGVSPFPEDRVQTMTDSAGPASISGSLGGTTWNLSSEVSGGSLLGFGSVTADPSAELFGTIAQVHTSYSDLITITSATLPIGSIDTMRVSIAPTFSLGAGGCLDNGDPEGTVDVNADFRPMGVGGNDFDFGLQENTCGGSFSTLSQDYDVIVGNQYSITYSLGLIVAAAPGTSITIDALNTVNVFLDPLGDFEYFAASGRNFQTPVPEPSTLLLLGTGLAMVGIRRKRQTK